MAWLSKPKRASIQILFKAYLPMFDVLASGKEEVLMFGCVGLRDDEFHVSTWLGWEMPW